MSETLKAVAAQLRQAYTTGAVSPLRDALAPTDGEGAYAVQHINTQVWQAEGPARIVGRKVGLTAKGGAGPAWRRSAGFRRPVRRHANSR